MKPSDLKQPVKGTLLVAFDRLRGIGRAGIIPWKISADLKQFRAKTLTHSVIMGRKTWDTLPNRPLADRLNIVVSRNPVQANYPGVIHTDSIENALCHAIYCKQDSKIFIIGGGQIYKYCLDNDLVDTIEATQIDGDYQCDTFFPDISDKWEATTASHHISPDSVGYSYVTYTKKTPFSHFFGTQSEAFAFIYGLGKGNIACERPVQENGLWKVCYFT